MISLDGSLKSERLLLRPFQEADFDDLYALQSRPDVTRYLPYSARSREEVRTALAAKTAQTVLGAEGDVLSCAVSMREAGPVIGEVLLFYRSAASRQGELGYVFHPDYHGLGFATEACSVMLEFAFSVAGLHRVYARADARNIASLNVMRRLGMRQEAHFVENDWFKGEWGDEVVCAILAAEWRRAATAH